MSVSKWLSVCVCIVFNDDDDDGSDTLARVFVLFVQDDRSTPCLTFSTSFLRS